MMMSYWHDVATKKVCFGERNRTGVPSSERKASLLLLQTGEDFMRNVRYNFWHSV